MRKVLCLQIAQHITDYYSPHSKASFLDTSTNQLIILNAREIFPATRISNKVFYSEAIFDFDTKMIISMPKSERRFLK